MRTRHGNSKAGIALIIVMIVITALGILAGGFAYSMKVETTLARNATFSSDLDWAARSGIEVAKWFLSQSSQGPEGQMDSLKQRWAGGPGTTNDILSEIDLKNYKVGDATLSIEIKDLDRKFNINAADEATLKQALTLIGADASVSSAIANSIMDWIDVDNDPRMGGAEDNDYERMDPPYFAKNGRVDDLTELLWVKGIRDDPNLYWGSQSAAAGGMPRAVRRASQSIFDQPTYAVGLVDLFTPLSSRAVNINTTTASVLKMLVDPATGIAPIDDTIAQAIISGPAGRAGIDGQDGTEDDMPFRSAQEVQRVPEVQLNPPVLNAITRNCNTRSLIFSVTVSVNIGGIKRECVAILRRANPKDIQTLNMYWKS